MLTVCEIFHVIIFVLLKYYYICFFFQYCILIFSLSCSYIGGGEINWYVV